jgi:hypothetical protein
MTVSPLAFGHRIYSPVCLADDWKLLDRCMPVLAAEYRHEARRGCFLGTRETVLDKVEAWVKGSEKSAIFYFNGLVGTGKSVIAQTVAERMPSGGLLGASFFCSRAFEDRNNIHLIFPTLAYPIKQRTYPSVVG